MQMHLAQLVDKFHSTFYFQFYNSFIPTFLNSDNFLHFNSLIQYSNN